MALDTHSGAGIQPLSRHQHEHVMNINIAIDHHQQLPHKQCQQLLQHAALTCSLVSVTYRQQLGVRIKCNMSEQQQQ